MTAKQLDPRPFFVLGVIAVIGVGGFLILGGETTHQDHYRFASCLADSGATMYGFDACPHCNKQKTLIGKDAFAQNFSERGYYVRCRPDSEASEGLGDRAEKISSVEPLEPSDTQGDACEVNVGSGTPTWVIDGEKYVGAQSIERLADLTGCPVPEDYEETNATGNVTSLNQTE